MTKRLKKRVVRNKRWIKKSKRRLKLTKKNVNKSLKFNNLQKSKLNKLLSLQRIRPTYRFKSRKSPMLLMKSLILNKKGKRISKKPKL